MRVGLLADTHDRVPAILALLRLLAERGVGLVLHAGDFCSPFSLGPMLELNMPLAGVFGRNDGDHESLRAFAAAGVGIELYESPHSMQVGEERILLVHDIGEVHQRSIEGHGIVVHGSTHMPEVRQQGETLLVNPGEGCGWLRGVPTAAVLDLETRQVEQLRLDEGDWRV